MSIKIPKISYFSFAFKLNQKNKVPLKNIVWRGGLQEKFGWRREGLMFNRGLKIFEKRADLIRKGRRKYGGWRL